ncbi:hypothetical protein L1049_022181 [Liquidambar formosana]|uniref:IST1-like protein n=1 Tax=Liquidambar formosana TaxID=63359 RepID=A0AAP0RC60_LIQFO
MLRAAGVPIRTRVATAFTFIFFFFFIVAECSNHSGGLTNVKCHEKFKSCIKKVQKSGKVGFSRKCPYGTAVPTMVQVVLFFGNEVETLNNLWSKISLKLAVSRIKLLKNKRDALIKQQKRELAQLLESGQEQTARIRVEHVVREEKTMAAYDLIEIYCELIVARLPIIEAQKNCPIDLKEAITSVIFASPRCADVPELMDVRKHFTAKYGKEFISSAVELRPDCGVSRMLVEKLSAKAPDGPTKINILGAIAEEHNIKWDPKSFGEKDAKPPEDLLNGPNTFQKASKMNVEPPSMQAPPNHDQKPDVPVNSFEHNVRSELSSQNFASTDIGASKTAMSGTSHPEVRAPGTRAEGMEFRHSFSGDGNAFPSGGQNWNMEFKDATSAAQAAAESAERASMAARAAAELSSRGKITRQYSRESQKPSIYGFRDEDPGKYAGSELHGEHLAKDSAN